jgi:hypothetical protein
VFLGIRGGGVKRHTALPRIVAEMLAEQDKQR